MAQKKVQASQVTVQTSDLVDVRGTPADTNLFAFKTIKGVAAGTRVPGSGYTDGTYTATTLTGSAFATTAAQATITVAGGAVTSVVVTAPGEDYHVGDVLTASIPGGTGFTFTVTSLTTAGYWHAVPAPTPGGTVEQIVVYAPGAPVNMPFGSYGSALGVLSVNQSASFGAYDGTTSFILFSTNGVYEIDVTATMTTVDTYGAAANWPIDTVLQPSIRVQQDNLQPERNFPVTFPVASQAPITISSKFIVDTLVAESLNLGIDVTVFGTSSNALRIGTMLVVVRRVS